MIQYLNTLTSAACKKLALQASPCLTYRCCTCANHPLTYYRQYLVRISIRPILHPLSRKKPNNNRCHIAAASVTIIGQAPFNYHIGYSSSVVKNSRILCHCGKLDDVNATCICNIVTVHSCSAVKCCSRLSLEGLKTAFHKSTDKQSLCHCNVLSIGGVYFNMI